MYLEYLKRLCNYYDNGDIYCPSSSLTVRVMPLNIVNNPEFTIDDGYYRMVGKDGYGDAGEVDREEAEASIEVFGQVGIQQLIPPDALEEVVWFRSGTGTGKAYVDYEGGGEHTPKINQGVLQRLGGLLEDLYGDPLMVKGVLYKNFGFFLYEVAPWFLYNKGDNGVMGSYLNLLDRGCITMQDFARKIRSYSPHLGKVGKLPRLTSWCVDWALKESGGAKWPAVIYTAKSRAKVPIGQLEPEARCLLVKNEESLTGEEEMSGKTIFVMEKSNNWGLDEALKKVISFCRKNKVSKAKIVVDGLATPQEYCETSAVAQKLYNSSGVAECMLGVLVSSWGQVLNMDSLLHNRIVPLVVLDVERLRVDGMGKRESLFPVQQCRHLELLQEVFGRNGVEVGALVRGNMEFSYYVNLADVSDFIITKPGEYHKAAFALCASMGCDNG